MSKTLKIIIGVAVLLAAIPLPVWLFWNESYEPSPGVDTWINSFHPYVAGLIGEGVILSFLGVLALGIFLIIPQKSKGDTK